MKPPSASSAPPRPKSRGAISNQPSRYDLAREEFDDGWSGAEEDSDDSPPPLKTIVTNDASKTIIARNQSPDIPFDRSINPYRGCEHGCIYCYARPSHAWLGLSPGLDFESHLFAKPQAAQLLDKELRAPSYRCAPIAIGTNTDAYQPIERERRLMRSILEVLNAFNHPVTIVTKGALVRRDIDLLAPMAARGLVHVSVSITTLDRDLCRAMEPRAATPGQRLEILRALSEAGIPVAVMASPMIPRVNDHELERILEAARDHGATAARTLLLRLPLEVAPLFEEWLALHRPAAAEHVLSLMRQSHGGKVYRSTFGTRTTGSGPHAQILAKRFELACRRLGLAGVEVPLRSDLFAPPPRPGDQMSLF